MEFLKLLIENPCPIIGFTLVIFWGIVTIIETIKKKDSTEDEED